MEFNEGTVHAWGEVICPVKLPWHPVPKVALVIRAFEATDEVTLSLDLYPVRAA